MKGLNTNPAAGQLVEDVTLQLKTALAALSGTNNMPIQRARAIAACASKIIDATQVEVLLSTSNREKL